MNYVSVTDQMVAARIGMPWFVVRPEGQPVPITYSFSYGTPAVDSPTARAFRRAAIDHLKRINPGRVYSSHVIVSQPTLAQIRGGLTQQAQPVQAVAALAKRVVSACAKAPSSAIRAFATRMAATADTSLDTILVTPTFPQPMYEPLRDLSQDLLLPGLQNVPADSVLGLETNRRFVESYMVGLNVEMGRELCGAAFRPTSLAPISSFLGRRRGHQAAPYVGRPAAGRAPTRRRARISSRRSRRRGCAATPTR
jgi:hypothetical protein